MLRLNLAREPYWLDLGLGVRVQVEPLTTALMVAARSDPTVRHLPEGTSDDEIAVIFGKALADRAILDWEGVGDADGNPTPVTPDGVAALLDIWLIFERFQMDYVAKGLELELEKKRLRALADWTHGGGEAYCAACQGPCPDCPQILNAPRTWEGWQVWDLGHEARAARHAFWSAPDLRRLGDRGEPAPGDRAQRHRCDGCGRRDRRGVSATLLCSRLPYS